MADTTEIRWIYPPNWAGELPGQQNIGFRRMSVLLTGTSDGSGETDAVKVNLSELKGPTGRIPTRTVIKAIRYEILGLTIVLEWDRAADIVIARLNAGTVAGNASGIIDFTEDGRQAGLVDPGGEGTGDILLTSTNAGAGDSYNIQIDFQLKED